MRRRPATTVYYGLEFLLSMPTWVVISIYLVRDLDLSPLELVLMGTAMEAAVFVFEVPTGVVADTYGRKLSLVIGFLGMGTTWLLVAVVSQAWLIIALWALWGIAYTFTSGAYEAWITDVRATVNSISGQADAIGQAAGGPVLGLVGNRFGTGAALAGGALLLTPALALYARAIRHGGREPELEELPAGAAP
jgi:DHA3 family tetracycline resistance protein-like MFS transporter